ncbi:aminomethyl-transferring glycine dehydrogenase subunit GcvPB [Acholeplasma vituli]|uniref:Probable glycine dehydrogenase (decarboxylating) subunit 2 n=1 Tax=Paracholeplasma vituli TaxID=69473 RepID=A0ABT2PTW6_9MOLU|nr:aminomethyl-transferring glycine dehydrogenase subunit GcvPB [Paracholeplasma vituli]MCU0104400.1 aminomethyl-transferring glycine dehydrogenase subunit GcvPB [Paracholeplasma vituli]
MKAYDQLIFELSTPNRVGYSLPKNDLPYDIQKDIPNNLKRTQETLLPSVAELDLVRHYSNVSRKNFGIETGFYPLGSCTMKYNPKINEEIAALPGLRNIHPLQPIETAQGSLEIYYDTSRMLSELSGMAAFSLNPFAGAQGELAGLMIMKAYHHLKGNTHKTKVIVPDSAHGTNPASATVAGFEIIEVKSNKDGTVNIKALKEAINDEVAGIMLTNPNTLGIFEKDILKISKLVHSVDGLLYYDGANLNALLGRARPGDMGFDIIHINLHKTFSTPHGGGGPGSGPVGVCKKLVEFLPAPQVYKRRNRFILDRPIHTIGHVSGFLGNFSVIIKAYSFMLTLGKENLSKVGELSVLNANYLKASLKDDFYLPIQGLCKHEVVFDGLVDKSTGVTTLDVAKRLLDFGIHPPTIYFPLVFHQSLMIEPVENESKETLDHFVGIMKQISNEAKTDPEMVKHAPYTTVVRRLDEVSAARNPRVKYRDLLK